MSHYALWAGDFRRYNRYHMSNFDSNLQRGNQPVIIGCAASKAAKDARVFQSVLSLPHQKAENKYSIPAQHYKLVLKDGDELKATVGRLTNLRASNDAYQHVQMRPDTSTNILYLWKDIARVRRERNPNKEFAGGEPLDSIGS